DPIRRPVRGDLTILTRPVRNVLRFRDRRVIDLLEQSDLVRVGISERRALDGIERYLCLALRGNQLGEIVVGIAEDVIHVHARLDKGVGDGLRHGIAPAAAVGRYYERLSPEIRLRGGREN